MTTEILWTSETIAERGTILQGTVGSTVHGTNISGLSDTDSMGICIEPPEYVIGLKIFEQHISRDQLMGVRSQPGDTDIVTYSLRKWVRLALKGNPSVLLLLFVPEDDLAVCDGFGFELRKLARLFASRKAAQPFMGYMRQQMERLVGERGQMRVTRTELIEQYGYDCYLDDTEFLTQYGWKVYDKIDDIEPLGTVNQITGELEFQLPTERIAKIYSGNLIRIKHRYSEVVVTPNHRMWVSRVNRGPSGRIGKAYRPNIAAWRFQNADTLDGAFFHTRVSFNPRQKDLPISNAYLNLIGAYVSEGCVAKRRTSGTASVLAFDQAVGGRLEPTMAAVGGSWPIRTYKYRQLASAIRAMPCDATRWTLADQLIAARVETECGSLSRNKHLPEWIGLLSERQANVLLDALMSGDGTHFRTGYWIYYTASKRLAGDVQVLALVDGRRSNVWGPYEPDGMYQVLVQQPGPRIVAFGKTNVFTEQVKTARIVCFTVPNETLVTRRHGRIAIHGNTKYASHVIRLGYQGIEFLTTGRITLPMPESQRQEVLAIRRGEWTLDKCLTRAGELEVEIKDLSTNSPLPEEPDSETVERWMISTYARNWEGRGLWPTQLPW